MFGSFSRVTLKSMVGSVSVKVSAGVRRRDFGRSDGGRSDFGRNDLASQQKA